jgi:hypothetical protein
MRRHPDLTQAVKEGRVRPGAYRFLGDRVYLQSVRYTADGKIAAMRGWGRHMGPLSLTPRADGSLVLTRPQR